MPSITMNVTILYYKEIKLIITSDWEITAKIAHLKLALKFVSVTQ